MGLYDEASVKDPRPIPKLTDLINPSEVPMEAIPDLRGELARLDTLLLGRWLSANRPAERQPQGDRLLSVPEAAALLSKKHEDIYRHDYEFKVKDRARVKCSENGVQEYIRQLKKAR